MLKLLTPILMIAGLVVWWKIRAQGAGHAMRRASRPVQNDQIGALLDRLGRAAGVGKVELRLLDEPSINGLATDTGDIYITRGLLDRFRAGEVSARELAGVAAHEMGHLALGHTRRRMAQMAGVQAVQLVLGGVLARFIPFIGPLVAANLLRLVTARLSRADEFEADSYATALMVRSGIGAEHLATLLEKLPKMVPGGGGGGPQWLASHPPVDERARAIRDNAARWQAHAPIEEDPA